MKTPVRQTQQGSNIKPIFVLSLPRSGSTLLQRILSAHTAIYSQPEPWLLLPYVYARRTKGIYTAYWQKVSVQALEQFISSLPGGEATYTKQLREFVLQLYERAADDNSEYFLDKTPRYHLIVDEIRAIFPEARFIFLWRNPISIVSSILRHMPAGMRHLSEYRVDLFCGLEKLVSAYRREKDHAISINYESLVVNPQKETKRLFDFLGLDAEEGLLEEIGKSKWDVGFGDRSALGEIREIGTQSISAHSEALANPIRRAWCQRYLKLIGKDTWKFLGYDFDEMRDELKQARGTLPWMVKDLRGIGRGLLWSFVSPRLLKDNLAHFPNLRDIHLHY